MIKKAIFFVLLLSLASLEAMRAPGAASKATDRGAASQEKTRNSMRATQSNADDESDEEVDPELKKIGLLLMHIHAYVMFDDLGSLNMIKDDLRQGADPELEFEGSNGGNSSVLLEMERMRLDMQKAQHGTLQAFIQSKQQVIMRNVDEYQRAQKGDSAQALAMIQMTFSALKNGASTGGFDRLEKLKDLFAESKARAEGLPVPVSPQKRVDAGNDAGGSGKPVRWSNWLNYKTVGVVVVAVAAAFVGKKYFYDKDEDKPFNHEQWV